MHFYYYTYYTVLYLFLCLFPLLNYDIHEDRRSLKCLYPHKQAQSLQMVRLQQILNREAGHIRSCHRSALSQKYAFIDPPVDFFWAQIHISSFIELIMFFSWRDTRKEQTNKVLWARLWSNLYLLWWRKTEGVSGMGEQRGSVYCSPRSGRSKG